MRLVLATRNEGKVREIEHMLEPLGLEILSLRNYPDIPDVKEDGKTFLENAVKKAVEVARFTGELSLADDSGLEVDFLDGAPGVHSARFAGPDKDDRANNEKLLRLMDGVPPSQRTARFRCVVAIADPDGSVYTAEGVCEGVIGTELRGQGGFGYDPLFYVPEYGRTFAELDLEVKNSISHRGRAMLKAVSILKEIIEKKRSVQAE